MKILGIMSGSSLDGIDMALVEFEGDTYIPKWRIIKAKTYSYDEETINMLSNLPLSTARELSLADYKLGYIFGEKAKIFLNGENIDYIASHGHTIFHEPHNKMTMQIGNGAAIASSSGINTISDFRSLDIGYQGQGAPIVAVLDRYIFSEYKAVVNLGGISNISFNFDDKTIAYDISPCNQLLNYLAKKINLDYDKDGIIASKAEINKNLLETLLKDEYYKQNYPKSLDNNYIKNKFIPLLENDNSTIEDKMATVVELIALTLSEEIKKYTGDIKNTKIMLAGGGAHNGYLVKRIKSLSKNIDIIVPDKTITDYKEALLMAYMAYLRVLGKTNVLASATGAIKDSTGGAIYLS